MNTVKVELSAVRSKFYSNLVLNLTSYLSSVPGIVDTQLQDRIPQDKIAIALWQQQNDVRLPSDVVDFYTATDGFRLSWSFRLNGTTHPVGLMAICRMDELTCVVGTQRLFGSHEEGLNNIRMGPQDVPGCPFLLQSKFVALSTFKEGCACLVLEGSQNHGIWFVETRGSCHFLAPDFTTYFRLLLLYQGLPQWPFLCIKKPLDPWPKQMFLYFAPHLLLPWTLPPNQTATVSYNELDISVFRTKKK